MVAPQPSHLSDAEVLDAIVIGGGPAGLSVALVLGRCLRRIRVIETPISRLEGEGDKLERIRFTDSNFLLRSALFFSPGQYQRSSLGAKLGCEFCEDNCIQCGENAATNIPGVYAVGNASRGVQLVIAAAAEGMEAAFAINSALLDADTASNALRDH